MQSAVHLAQQVDAAALVVTTVSGGAARAAAKYRPRLPVIALSEDQRVRRQLALEWGVVPGRLPPRPASAEELAALMLERAREVGGLESARPRGPRPRPPGRRRRPDEHHDGPPGPLGRAPPRLMQLADASLANLAPPLRNAHAVPFGRAVDRRIGGSGARARGARPRRLRPGGGRGPDGRRPPPDRLAVTLSSEAGPSFRVALDCAVADRTACADILEALAEGRDAETCAPIAPRGRDRRPRHHRRRGRRRRDRAAHRLRGPPLRPGQSGARAVARSRSSTAAAAPARSSATASAAASSPAPWGPVATATHRAPPARAQAMSRGVSPTTITPAAPFPGRGGARQRDGHQGVAALVGPTRTRPRPREPGGQARAGHLRPRDRLEVAGEEGERRRPHASCGRARRGRPAPRPAPPQRSAASSRRGMLALLSGNLSRSRAPR